MTKKIIYRLLIVIILIVVTDKVVGHYLDGLYKKNRCDFSNGKLNVFLEEDNVDTIIVGSSRVLHTIKPNILGKGVKTLAFQHKHIYHNAVIIDLLKQEQKLPRKVLIFNIEMEDLYIQYEPRLLEQLYSLKYYYSKNGLAKELINRKGYQESLKFLSSVYRHNGEGWKLIAYPRTNLCSPVSETGYVPLIPNANDSARLSRSLIDDFKPYNFKKINPKVIALLEGIINTCDEMNIDLIFINAPYFKYHPEFIYASNYMKKFCREKNVRYVDFNEELITGLEQPEMWYDNMHLNDNGANIYTKYLKSKLTE